MKRFIRIVLIMLITMFLLTACSRYSLSGTWNATGGVDRDGRSVDVHGFFGEYRVVIKFSKDTFTMIVEDSYEKDYAFEYKNDQISFTDSDEYISFSQQEQGAKVTFDVKTDGKKMVWTLPGTQVKIEFEKE